MFQQCGFVAVVISAVTSAAMSTVCGLSLIRASQLIPGNGSFSLRYEYATIAKYYLSRRVFLSVSLTYCVFLLFTVLPMIIQVVQVVDVLLVKAFNVNYAIQLLPSWGLLVANDDLVNQEIASTGAEGIFGQGNVVVTLGMVVSSIVLIPLSFKTLSAITSLQGAAACTIMFLICSWVAIFLDDGLVPSRVPAVGSGGGFRSMVGVVMFNYAFSPCLPSWVNEKRASTKVEVAVVVPLLCATVIFFTIGILGGMAYDPYYKTSLTIIDKLLVQTKLAALSKWTFFIFPLAVNVPTIPVMKIMLRYNLQSNHIKSTSRAKAVASFLPWVLVTVFYSGNGFANVINYTGLLLCGLCSYILPLVFYIKSMGLKKIRRDHDILPTYSQSLSAAFMPVDFESHLPLPSAGVEVEQRAVTDPLDYIQRNIQGIRLLPKSCQPSSATLAAVVIACYAVAITAVMIGDIVVDVQQS
jgi:hypothetical protein